MRNLRLLILLLFTVINAYSQDRSSINCETYEFIHPNVLATNIEIDPRALHESVKWVTMQTNDSVQGKKASIGEPQHKSPVVAGILSGFLFPGAGQYYNGNLVAGVTFTTLGTLAVVGTGARSEASAFMFIMLYVGSITQAVVEANSINARAREQQGLSRISIAPFFCGKNNGIALSVRF